MHAIPAPGTLPRARAVLSALAVVALLPLAGCTSAAPSPAGEPEPTVPVSPTAVTAERVLQVTSPHEATGMTLLEGPTFDAEGRLHLVDVTAPDGEAKVMRIDLDTEEITPLVTEGEGAFTSAQWSPADGRLHLTDYVGGRIVSVTAEGEDPQTVFEGEVEGRAMHPDDLAFDEQGNMFISDSSPTTHPDAAPTGRVVRIDAGTAEATVLADNQPNPNGISLDPDGGALWISQLDANRVDRLALNEDGTAVTSGHTAIHVDGGSSQADSNALDAAGNIYQASHGIPRILVYGPDGTHRATIDIPAEHEGLESATNLAILPGTTDAYMTVSGPSGGFVYRFDALAEGSRQSNGG
ncbi:SMP-30/gluconolactonase/LRE family protein [Brachybacterium sp. AOP29-B2-41]|uniref:SMP-30/gluconolactonase/LRE family protein n=1 Tax=Brachybacterium sp. AOP29-B2-41 TaxID=3457704 RepID=UPI004034C664